MARGTYTSEILNEISKEVKEKFGVCVWFAEILGRRWSYIAGEKSDDLFMPPERIKINDRLGVVIECEDEEKLKEVIEFLKKRLEF